MLGQLVGTEETGKRREVGAVKEEELQRRKPGRQAEIPSKRIFRSFGMCTQNCAVSPIISALAQTLNAPFHPCDVGAN